MKTQLACLVCLIMLLIASVAVAEISFGATEELLLPEWLTDAIYVLEDGGFLLAGREAKRTEDATCYCMRTDGYANELWRIQTSKATWFIGHALLSDGSIALIQKLGDNGQGRNLIVVHDGVIVYDEPFSPGDEQVYPQLYPANEGFFLTYGERRQADKHRGTFHVPALEYRAEGGSILWKYIFEEHEANIKGALAVEGGHILYGETEEQETGERYTDGFVIKMDDQGNILWVQTSRSDDVRWRSYHGEGVLLEDGGFVLTGSITYLAKDGEYPTVGLLAQFDGDGNLVWEKTYSLHDAESYAVHSLTPMDTGYLMLGEKNGYRLPTDILYVDAQGEILETAEKEWDSRFEMSYTFLDNQTGGLRLIARKTPPVGEGAANEPRMLLITPVAVQ